MKNNRFLEYQPPTPALQSEAPLDWNQNHVYSKPSPDEVARRACSAYVNQGSIDGYDQQHWLEAEAQLAGERIFSRVFLFRNLLK